MPKRGQGLAGDLDALTEAIRRYPWTTLASLRDDRQILGKIDDVERLLKDLRRALKGREASPRPRERANGEQARKIVRDTMTAQGRTQSEIESALRALSGSA